MGFEYIGAGKVDNYIDRSDTVIVDLRKPIDYRKGHIKGAVNMSYNILDRELDKLAAKKVSGRNLAGDDPGVKVTDSVTFFVDKIYIFYCERGSLSLAICAKMTRLGFNVKSVVGGLRQYRGKFMEKQ